MKSGAPKIPAGDVVFRCDAAHHIGSGHVMRCLALGAELRRRGRTCRFICRALPGHMGQTITAQGFALSLLPAPPKHETGENWGEKNWLGVSQEHDAAQTRAALHETGPKIGAPAWLIVDHYGIDATWERAVLPQGWRLLAIDDLADRPHASAMLLDCTLGRRPNEYAASCAPHTVLLLGASFALLRPEFAAQRRVSLARRSVEAMRDDTQDGYRVLISMGGYDVPNATAAVLDMLTRADHGGHGPKIAHLDVVMGRAAPHLAHINSLLAECSIPHNVHIDTQDMAGLLTQADLVIGAAGTSAWERACLGVPSILILLADNQRSGAQALHAAGAAYDVGAPGPELDARFMRVWHELSDRQVLSGLSRRAAALCAGRGTSLVADALSRGELHLRRAAPHDCRAIWEWRMADSAAARFYRSAAQPSLEEHRLWYAQALQDPARFLLIAERAGQALGYSRFDLQNPHDSHRSAYVSICLAPAARGCHFSAAILGAALDKGRRAYDIKTYFADVHEDNAPSRRLFENLGFTHTAQEGAFLTYSLTASDLRI